MPENPTPVTPLPTIDDDQEVPEPFRRRLHQLLADPTLTHAQIAMKMVEFQETQPRSPTPPTPHPTPTKTCHPLPNTAIAPHPPTNEIWQNEPIFPPPNPANHCQPLPIRPKTNPPSVASSLRGFVAHSSQQRPLTPQQLRAIHLLRAGHPAAVIAQTLHINRHTISTWKRLPHFQQELKHQIALEHPTPDTPNPTPAPEP